MAPFAIAASLLYNHLSYDVISDLPADAPSVAGTRVLQQHFPAGIMGTVTVLLVDPQVDFDKPSGRETIRQVTERLREQRKELGLADIRSFTAKLGISKAATNPAIPPDLPEDVRRKAIEVGSRDRYLTAFQGRTMTGTRLDLVLTQSPFTHWSVEDLNRIEEDIRSALPETQRQNAKLYFTGTTASVRDLSGVIQSDRTRIEYLVVASVFVILLLLLRRLVITLYLLVSVLFSYYVTLGVTFALFWLLDPKGFSGIDWKVAIFLFTILIAVGEDYNIFLLTRVQEEEKRYGPVRGITEALVRTGPMISSCGIIMAGTFGSLLAGSLLDMKQLGFALAFGVLLDTFVVRPILVPAFLILLEGGRLPLVGRKERTAAQPAETPRPQETAS